MFARALQLAPARLTRPVFARSFAANTTSSEHDYVVIGAGSAGCILTHRLSAAGNEVCLLEAGPTDDTDIIQMPLKWADLFYNKTYNWNYWTAPQKELGDRKIYWPRGKALGGTSSVNSTVYMRPNPLDLDRWAYKENAYGWSYAETLPYFKRLEAYEPADDYPAEQLQTYRGFDGPVRIVSGKLQSPKYPTHELYESFVQAGQQAGLKYTHDANGYRQEGVFWIDTTVVDGMRVSATAYLKLALQTNPKRVHVHVNTVCTKLLFDGSQKRVIGVETADANDTSKRKRYFARKDVVLSAGTINSPQLLQLSGIGNADQLRQQGVQVVLNLPGVGGNLQDHVRLVIIDECKPVDLDTVRRSNSTKLPQFRCPNGRAGMVLAGAHLRTSQEFQHPNVQVHFGDGLYHDTPNVELRQLPNPVTFMTAYTQRAHSRGFVRLASGNPFDHPIIDPQLFADSRDVPELISAFKAVRPIFQQKAFQPTRKGELFPGPDVKSDKDIEQVVRSSSITAYHPCGTCKMGDILKDPLAVVDPRSMRVFGLDGLRVVDASVIPSEPSCNVNAPTMMIAERASDLILGNKLLPAENAPFHR